MNALRSQSFAQLALSRHESSICRWRRARKAKELIELDQARRRLEQEARENAVRTKIGISAYRRPRRAGSPRGASSALHR